MKRKKNKHTEMQAELCVYFGSVYSCAHAYPTHCGTDTHIKYVCAKDSLFCIKTRKSTLRTIHYLFFYFLYLFFFAMLQFFDILSLKLHVGIAF